MTVKELITQLQQYDSDMLVLLDGYEMGYDPIKEVKVETVIPNPANEECWSGQYLNSEDRQWRARLPYSSIPIQDNEEEMYFDTVVIKSDRSGR